MSPARSTGRPAPADPVQRDADSLPPSVGERPTAALGTGRSGVMVPTIMTTVTSTTGTGTMSTAAAAVRAGLLLTPAAGSAVAR